MERHRFAVNCVRNGGSVFHLQKLLGHSSLEMTRKYANLVTEDLQKMHPQVSLGRRSCQLGILGDVVARRVHCLCDCLDILPFAS
jgi:hypothetical protein